MRELHQISLTMWAKPHQGGRVRSKYLRSSWGFGCFLNAVYRQGVLTAIQAMDASILLANDYPSGFQQRTPEAEADGIRFEQSADNWDGGLSVLENELTRHEGYVEPAQPPLPIYR